MTRPDDRRAELLEQLALAGGASSAATVMFHTAVAARQGLSASEEKALDLLERSGRSPPASWPGSRGWPQASVTALINRLEAKGSPGGSRTPATGAACSSRSTPSVYATVAPLFADWVGSLQELYAGYTDEQLEVILHFLNEAARRQRDATARLTE